MDYTEIATKYLEYPDKYSATGYLLSLNLSTDQFFLVGDYIKKISKQKQQKKYIYMLTFTVAPTKIPEITPEIEHNIQAMIHNQGCRAALNVVEYSYVKELHQNGRPHWHALIVTTNNLKKDRFKHYIDRYGNIDISKNKAQKTGDIIDYMSKFGEIIKVI